MGKPLLDDQEALDSTQSNIKEYIAESSIVFPEMSICQCPHISDFIF